MPYFNPRTHVGCDAVSAFLYNTEEQFQSTHPRGVRLPENGMYVTFIVFQSTHPRGVRLKEETVSLRKLLFQSTHPRGVRLTPTNG